MNRSHPFAFIFGALVATAALAAAPATQPALTDAERQKIDGALPVQAPAKPRQARKLLVFDLNMNYGGHRSIAHANYAFARMGEKTQSYQTQISHDPEIFRPDRLKAFDAVFFNNTVGNLFQDPGLRKSLMDFVTGGKGLLGLHGSSVAFTIWPGAKEDWPEFGRMLGARGANHRDSTEPVFIRVDDPKHPLVAHFDPGGFEYRDEFFRFGDPYSRKSLRVLLSIHNEKTDASTGGQARGKIFRKDNDYALAWVRSHGQGRVFYCTIGHNPYVFSDPAMLKFYLAAIQFALGDLDASTTPSAP